jgi:pimeloyl-ACP methyl ester carboxylesterase
MSGWILLRGLTREGRHWGSFPDALREAAGTDRITLLDLPGNGRETALRAPLGVSAMMKLVRARAAILGMAPPYRVLAMSLGAMVATDWAQRHPDEIERLVLVNTSMRPFCAVSERLRLAAWPEVAKIAASWADAPRCEKRIYALTCERVDTLADDLASWTQIRRSAGVSAANGLRQLWAAARFRASDEAPHCPVLLLSSRADRLVDPVCSARIAAVWQMPHAEHPWAGHDLPHDDPRWVGEAVAGWLGSLR